MVKTVNMLSLINLLVLLATTATVSAVSVQGCQQSGCNRGIYRYYKELGCRPIHEHTSCCPTRYDCSHLSNRTASQCYAGGQTYNIGDSVPTENLHELCVADCFCDEIDNNTRAELRCAEIECPELLGVPPPPGCRYVSTHDQCCAVGTVCAKKSSPAAFQCQHDSHSHHLGEEFYPDDRCLKCICQEGYDGTLREPWCKEIECGFEVHRGRYIQEGCVPVYLANRCCPFLWRCPEDTDSVVGSGDVPSGDESDTCVFGKLHLKVNEKLNPDCANQVECICSTPPFVSCFSGNSTC